MSRNDLNRIGKGQIVDAKAENTTGRVSPAYSAPRLVAIGRASTLVQGSDLYKMTLDTDGQWYHD